MTGRSISHYRLLERLGSGGVGEVYKAEDLTLHRTVAVKLLREGLSSSRTRNLLAEEARAAASLNHPKIATVYELGADDDQLFIAMEYVEGCQLGSRGERWNIAEAVRCCADVLDALGAAHSRGLIHCDINGSNVMLATDGSIKVLDFGIARIERLRSAVAWGHAEPEVLTTSVSGGNGEVAGTLGYMSPEQLRGEELDARTDIFSAGVVLYEMITGHKPFQGETVCELRRSILEREPSPLGQWRDDVPLELEGIARRALAKERSLRYQSAAEMRADLKRLLSRLQKPAAEHAGAARQGREGLARRSLPLIAFGRRWIFLLAVILAFGALIEAGLAAVNRGTPPTESFLAGLLALLLLAYATVVRPRRISAPEPELREGAAFRGLLPFQEADRDRFYGRGVETARLFDLVTSTGFRFGVLFGDSGSGKTSLVRAGLIPRLWETGYLPVYCRSHKDPVAAVIEECQRHSSLALTEGETPVDFLKRVASSMTATVIVVCDQFEEFFVSFKSAREREPFLRFVGECHNDLDLPIRFLVSLRSDFLYLINSAFEARIPDPLLSARLFHLRNLGEEQAAEIVTRSARRADLPFEPELCRYVARDLAGSGAVLPSELQIVGERLQSRRVFTVRDYKRAGGKEALVESFLDDVIQLCDDKDTCALLLRSLRVTRGRRFCSDSKHP